LCPKVEDLDYEGGMPYGPPEGHPLHTVLLDANWFRMRDSNLYPWSKFVPKWQSDWPGLRTFRVNEVWSTLKAYQNLPTNAQLKSLGLITLEDARGEPCTDYIERMGPEEKELWRQW
ncbi:14029_t:CDS:1, partial [Acaulospora colombiana]